MSKYDELINSLKETAENLKDEPYPNCILVTMYSDKFLEIYDGLKKYSAWRRDI